MKTRIAVSALLFIFLVSCTKVPITGRRQVNLLPESTLMGMSLTNYRQFLSQHPAAPSGDVDAQLVKKVGANIASAVEKFLKQKKMTKRIKGYKWEFNLVNDPTVN